MNSGPILCAPLLDVLPWTTFTRIVERQGGDRSVQRRACTEPFRVMACAPRTDRERLRDIEACLSAQAATRDHLGFRHEITRATLAEANETREWRISAELAQGLIVPARTLYLGARCGLGLKHTPYALNSTTIDLCRSRFPWALFRTTQSAVKRPTRLDLRGTIPRFIHIADGTLGDVTVLDVLVLEAGAIDVMDRGDLDGTRLYVWHQAHAFFVTRTKSNLQLRRVYSAPVDRGTGILCDQTVALTGATSRTDYPEHLRRIRFKDPETGKTRVCLTTNFTVLAATLCARYTARWQVDLFFKWIKPHLRIKKFYGHSEHAVQSPLWIAVSV